MENSDSILSINGLTGSEQANLLQNVLVFLHSTGVVICSITFDGARQNFNMVENLGAKFNVENLVTWFKHPVDHHRIFIFLDPCHMLKLIRSCLEFYKTLITDGNETAKWQHFVDLMELQKMKA